ncbi:MAG TPA: glycosyltransferase family 39 protein, partial [Terriglobales bacterium]|nr:glycosyltransferase family 39 protein [Terriglobales bacterium]
DMNFPGTYLVHLAVVALLGTGDAAWRAVDLGMTAVTAVLVAALAAPWGKAAAFGGASFFAAYHLAAGAWNAGQRDFLLCPCLLAAALGVARWAEGGGLRPVFGGGVALGAGLTIKPHAIVLLAALLAFIAVRGRVTLVPPLPAMAALAVGAALAPIAVVAWLAALGALGAWREIVFGYLVPLYSRVARPSDWLYFRWDAWIAILAALGVTLARLTATGGWTARHAVAALGLAYGAAHFLLQRKGWEYHAYPLAAFAAVLLFAQLAPARRRHPLRATPLATALVAVVWLLGVKGVEAGDSGWIALKERRVTALAADLAARTKAGDEVQVLDTTDGGVHALLRQRLRAPSRFLYDFHFYHHADAPMIQRLRAELVRDLGARAPALIVLWESGWPAGGYERIDGFPALRTLLTARYALVRAGDAYRIYAKRHDP